MKRTTLTLVSAALAAFSLSGCLEQEQKFVLNPDGSGKLLLDTTVSMNLSALGGGGGAGIGGPGKDTGKQMALQVLRGTQGVDVWESLSYESTPEGKTHVKGTAYFQDVAKLTMNAGEAAGGISASTLITRKEGDKWIIEMGTPNSTGSTSATPPAGGAKAMTPEQASAAVKQAQTQWQSMKALVGPMVQDAKVRTSVEVGGTITQSVGFSKESESVGLMEFNGGKVLEAIDKMLTDTKALEEAVAASGDPGSALRDQKRVQKALFEAMTDGQGLPRLVVTPGAAAFDYKAEVEKARAGQSAELKALLEEAKKPAGAVIRPPAGGGAPEKGKVAPPKPKKVD